MEGARVAGGYVERAQAALAAGCDMVLVCNNPQAAQQVLDGLGPHNDPASHARLIRMHGRGTLDRVQLQQQAQWQQAVEQLNVLSEDQTLDLGLA